MTFYLLKVLLGFSLNATTQTWGLHIHEKTWHGAQYVTPDSKIYCEKGNMCRFSSGNWFFCTKFVQLATLWLVKGATQLRTSQKGM
jgi:hypothetical protein